LRCDPERRLAAYDAVLEPSKAQAWWEIRPNKPENVLRMVAVA
jgi:hypothetical protein